MHDWIGVGETANQKRRKSRVRASHTTVAAEELILLSGGNEGLGNQAPVWSETVARMTGATMSLEATYVAMPASAPSFRTDLRNLREPHRRHEHQYDREANLLRHRI